MASQISSRQWVLKQLPEGEIKPFEDFQLKTVSISRDELKDGKVLLQLLYFSNDPAQRSWLVDKPDEEHYMPPVRPGNPMTAGAVAKVIESSAPEYQKDDLVFAFLSWSDIILFDTRTSPMPLIKLPSGIDPSDFLALGLTAQTAYSGLLGTGKATSKDSVIVVSAAAGATGSSVAQIAKNVLGVKNVWGIAGGPEKCKIAEQSGCDRCFDYRSPSFRTDFEKAAREAGFVDVYFDNTGGISSDVVMRVMSFRGRVVVCGAISIYEKDYDAPCDISAESWRVIIYKQLRVEGFIVTQSFDKEWQNKAQQDLMQWAKEGKLKPLKDIWEAKFEEVPTGMQKLLQGKNVGKLITKIVDYAKLE